MCTSHKHVEAAAADQRAFTTQMLSQAQTVFGAADKVFNQMQTAYSGILAAGPSQPGFSAAQQNAMNASAITAGANQARFATGALKSSQTGGGTPGTSGVNISQEAGLRSAIAGQTAGELNKIQQANWATGRENWLTAGQGVSGSAGAFSKSGATGFDAAAQKGLNENEAYAKAEDASANAWQSELSGAIGGGIKGFMKKAQQVQSQARRAAQSAGRIPQPHKAQISVMDRS